MLKGPYKTKAQDDADRLAADNEQLRRATFDADTELQALAKRLREATATQIGAYVDNNVTDLASARAMLKRILVLLGALLAGKV